jgi:hypothetical protein
VCVGDWAECDECQCQSGAIEAEKLRRFALIFEILFLETLPSYV